MWDEKYSSEIYQYGKEPNQFLKDNFSCIRKGKVLCLAEGEGRNAIFLAEQGYQVTAVDSSIVGLNKARKLAKEHNVEVDFIQADLAHYELGHNCWDGIISIFCHLPETLRVKLHKQIVIGLKNQGTFLLEAYTPEQLLFKTGGPGSVSLMLSEKELQDHFKDLEFKLLAEKERDIQEGILHAGIGAVVQLIAQKVRD